MTIVAGLLPLLACAYLCVMLLRLAPRKAGYSHRTHTAPG